MGKIVQRESACFQGLKRSSVRSFAIPAAGFSATAVAVCESCCNLLPDAGDWWRSDSRRRVQGCCRAGQAMFVGDGVPVTRGAPLR